MRIRQVSVFLENRRGQVYSELERLASEGINLRAVALAESERYGILRMIVDDPDATAAIVRGMGITVQIVPVFGAHVPDRPGALAELLALFKDTDISVRYMYTENSGGRQAQLMLRLQPEDAAEAILEAAGY